MRFISVFCGITLSLGLFCGCAAGRPEPSIQSEFQSIVSSARSKVFPALVYIRAVTGNLESGRDQSNVVSGSGVMISADGELLSNCHVVDKAESIRCLLNDGRAFSAKVIGMDKDLDLALLKLELPPNTPPLPFAALDVDGKLTEGDFVMAMGAPWGLNRSVSIGIISCAARYLPENGQYSLWYQTDAAISPGNSGGPLVNTDGKVVGINTLGMMMGGAIAFSIPSPTIRDVLPRLRQYGKVNWAWFGFMLQPLADFDRNIYFNYPDGVMIAGTEPDSPARKAGFLPDDRIIAVNGNPVTVANGEAMPGFRRTLGLMPFDKPVDFTVVRTGQTRSISVAPVDKGKVEGDESACPRWGLTAKAINRFDTPDLFYYKEKGVYIYGTAPYGNAARADLRRNDIILAVNGKPVSSLQELNTIYQNALNTANNDPKALFTLQRNGRTIEKVMDFSNDY